MGRAEYYVDKGEGTPDAVVERILGAAGPTPVSCRANAVGAEPLLYPAYAP